LSWTAMTGIVSLKLEMSSIGCLMR
jgi:hypothetical protein